MGSVLQLSSTGGCAFCGSQDPPLLLLPRDPRDPGWLVPLCLACTPLPPGRPVPPPRTPDERDNPTCPECGTPFDREQNLSLLRRGQLLPAARCSICDLGGRVRLFCRYQEHVEPRYAGIAELPISTDVIEAFARTLERSSELLPDTMVRVAVITVAQAMREAPPAMAEVRQWLRSNRGAAPQRGKHRLSAARFVPAYWDAWRKADAAGVPARKRTAWLIARMAADHGEDYRVDAKTFRKYVSDYIDAPPNQGNGS